MDEQYQAQQEQDNESGMDLCEAWHYEQMKDVADDLNKSNLEGEK